MKVLSETAVGVAVRTKTDGFAVARPAHDHAWVGSTRVEAVEKSRLDELPAIPRGRRHHRGGNSGKLHLVKMSIEYRERHAGDWVSGEAEGPEALGVSRDEEVGWKASEQPTYVRESVSARRLDEVAPPLQKLALLKGLVDKQKFAVAIAQAHGRWRAIKREEFDREVRPRGGAGHFLKLAERIIGIICEYRPVIRGSCKDSQNLSPPL